VIGEVPPDAAAAFEVVIKDFGQSKYAADAVYNAGVLRQALGQHEKAIGHYQDYTKRFKDRKDAAEVAFRIGVVYEDAGDDGREAIVQADVEARGAGMHRDRDGISHQQGAAEATHPHIEQGLKCDLWPDPGGVPRCDSDARQ